MLNASSTGEDFSCSFIVSDLQLNPLGFVLFINENSSTVFSFVKTPDHFSFFLSCSNKKELKNYIDQLNGISEYVTIVSATF